MQIGLDGDLDGLDPWRYPKWGTHGVLTSELGRHRPNAPHGQNIWTRVGEGFIKKAVFGLNNSYPFSLSQSICTRVDIHSINNLDIKLSLAHM